MSIVHRPIQNNRVGGALTAQQKALRAQKRQSAPMANFLHQYTSNGLGVSALDKENTHAATPSKTKSIIKKSDSEAKKQKAAKKRRVSFSSQLENVRFFVKENGVAGSPQKAASTPAKPRFESDKTNESNVGDHDTMEDDFEREKDLLATPVESTPHENTDTMEISPGPFNFMDAPVAPQPAPAAVAPAPSALRKSGTNKQHKRRASVGFIESSREELSDARRSSLPTASRAAPVEPVANAVSAPSPAPASPATKMAGVVAPIARSWEEDFGFVYGPSVIDSIAPVAEFDNAAPTSNEDANTGLISFDDRRMSVSGLASPGSIMAKPLSRTPLSQPSTPNPGNISQLLFGSPMSLSAPKQPAQQPVDGRRESLMEFTGIVGSAADIQLPTDNSMEVSMDQESNTIQAAAADSTGSFGAIMKSRGVKRQRRDSVGALLRRGIDWDTLEEGFESRPAAELSARIEADEAAQLLNVDDDLIDAVRPSKRRMSSAMDLTGVVGGITGLAGSTGRLSMGGAGTRSRRTSDVMDLTNVGTSRINMSGGDDMLADPVIINGGGNASLSEDDVSNMTLNLTKTFNGLASATRRFSLGAGDPDAMMEQTAAVGRIIGLAGDSDNTSTTKRTNRLSLPMDFAGANESHLDDHDPFPGSQNMHMDLDDGMDMTTMGTSKIQMGGADMTTRRQSLGMDFTTAIDNNILMAEPTGRMSRRASLSGTSTAVELDRLMAGMGPSQHVALDDEEDMQMATGRPAVILQSNSNTSGNWSMSDDSNNESSMGTETIEARVNMEANKQISASPNSSIMAMASPSMDRSRSMSDDRRKSIGMELTGVYGSILASTEDQAPQASPADRRKSMGMDFTNVFGGIIRETEAAKEQVETFDDVQQAQQQEAPAPQYTEEPQLQQEAPIEVSEDTGDHSDGLLLNMSLRDELAAMQQESTSTGIILTNTLTGTQSDNIEKSRRESVGALLFQSGFGVPRVEEDDRMDVDVPVPQESAAVEPEALPVATTKQFEPSTPNATMTMRARAVADFPIATPLTSNLSSIRTTLHSGEPMTLERFVFLTNLRFANHRRSSVAPSMQTAVEPRSENAKIHTFFVSSKLSEIQEQISSRLADEVRGAKERIQALEQKVRAAAAQNNIPVFRALQSTTNEREIAKITQDLTKFKSALKYDAKTEVQEHLIGRPVEEAKQVVLSSISERLHSDAVQLEQLKSQQTLDSELLRAEKDGALFRRYSMVQQKPRRGVEKENAKARAEAMAEAEEHAAILTGVTGWKSMQTDQNSLVLQLQDTIRVSVTLPATARQSAKFRVEPIGEAGFKRSMLESMLPQLELGSLFSNVQTHEGLRSAIHAMATRVGRSSDMIKETIQLKNLFVAKVEPAQDGICVSSTFASSTSLNRFHVQLHVRAPPAYPYAADCVSVTSFENDFGVISNEMVQTVVSEQLRLAAPSPLLRIFRALDKMCVDKVDESSQ